MAKHYRQALQTPDRKLYKAVAELGGWCNIKCEIIETFGFTTKEELWEREDAMINLEDPLCLNTVRAILSSEERAEQKREVKRKCWKKWMEDPEFAEEKRRKAKELYDRRKSDPEFLAKRREAALASYHRRKAKL